MESAVTDKLQAERMWTDHRMSRSINWNLFKSTHIHYLKERKTLVVWRLSGGQPLIQAVLEVEDVGINFGSGLHLTLQDHTGRRYTVNSTPREVLPEVFLWTPHFSEVRFTPAKFDQPDSPRQLTLPMCCKTRSRADRPVEGHCYISSMKEFCQAWPNANS